MIAARADLRTTRDWIPRRVGPLNRRSLRHDSILAYVLYLFNAMGKD